MKIFGASLMSVGVLVAFVSSVPAHADIISATDATNPLAFFPLQTANGPSTVNGYTSTNLDGAANVASNGGPQSNALLLNGINNGTPQYVSTSLFGNINGQGSIEAWINLASTNGGQIEYIAGESQSGDDFDLQVEFNDPTSEKICFYTAGGGNTCAIIATTALLNTWTMVTATYNASVIGNDQDVYIDGALEASNNQSSFGQKNDVFTIGYSSVFGNRDFDGSISDVGVWNYQLSSGQVADLYSAAFTATPPSTSVPEPLTFSLFGAGLAGAAAMRRRKKV